VVLIFIILFVLYGNFKFPATIALGVIMTEPVGVQRPLKLTPPREADGVAAATASDHDDRFGRVSRVAAGGALRQGSDTQKPFAIVIVAGLISHFFIGFFVSPTLYNMVAHEGEVLQV
jgi:cobalt-zinc-cadmium resistance protein CzcA